MRRISLLGLAAVAAAGVCLVAAPPVSGALGKLETPSVGLPAEYPAPARAKVEAALKRKDIRFLDGHWLNSFTSLRYAGETRALNLFLDDLAKCPGVTVSVSFTRALEEDCDWRVSHMRYGFHVQVNLSSKRVKLEDLVIPEAAGPSL